MNIDPRLLRQARIAHTALLLTVIFGLAGGLLVLAQASSLSAVIARVFIGKQSLAQVIPLLRWLLAVFILRAGVVLGGEVAANGVAVRVKGSLRELLLEKLIRLGPAYQARQESGELVASALQGVESLDAYFSQFLPQLVLAAMIPLAVLVAVFPRDLLSGAVLLLTAPLIPIFMILIGRLSEALTTRQFTALKRMSAFFLDTLQGLTTLKALGQSHNRAARISEVSECYRRATMGVLQTTFLSALVLELVGTLSTAIVAVEIGLRLMYGRLGFEQALFILIVAPEFYLPLRTLGLRFHAGMSGVAAARRIFEILDTPETDARSQSGNVYRSARLTGSWIDQPVCFESVTYYYPGREEAVLKDISFCIQPGELVALVGRSGAGKSTLAHLLLGFIQPTGGKIRAGHQRMQDIPIEDWRRQIAWVGQQPVLFQGSLVDNLRIAKDDASLEEIQRAAEQAGLAEVVAALPSGWDTRIGDGGVGLSGGQAQRLALARAFLRDAPLLILDEPTAHLDPVQEMALADVTRRLCVDRTVLVIAHRLQTVREADNILVLEDGHLVEMGQHDDLLAQGGAYARLLRAGEGGE
ncbi:thiol reductant ABC exporter subunit CydD [Longilinea arvoryzae]|nr:thiol reductant ABC exporter subunit CydD [Longilinea arvoryzae]